MRKIITTAIAGYALLVAMFAQAGPVNINTADAATLAAELTGVGPALALAIVDDRDRNGRFNTAEELVRVSGIGMSVVESNREFILVDSAS